MIFTVKVNCQINVHDLDVAAQFYLCVWTDRRAHQAGCTCTVPSTGIGVAEVMGLNDPCSVSPRCFLSACSFSVKPSQGISSGEIKYCRMKRICEWFPFY